MLEYGRQTLSSKSNRDSSTTPTDVLLSLISVA